MIPVLLVVTALAATGPTEQASATPPKRSNGIIALVDGYDTDGARSMLVSRFLEAKLRQQGYDISACETLFGVRTRVDELFETAHLRVATAENDDPLQLLAMKATDCLSTESTYMFASGGIGSEGPGGETSAWFTLITITMEPDRLPDDKARKSNEKNNTRADQPNPTPRITDYHHGTFAAADTDGLSELAVLGVAVDNALHPSSEVSLRIAVESPVPLGEPVLVSALGTKDPRGLPLRVEFTWQDVSDQRFVRTLQRESAFTAAFVPPRAGTYLVTVCATPYHVSANEGQGDGSPLRCDAGQGGQSTDNNPEGLHGESDYRYVEVPPRRRVDLENLWQWSPGLAQSMKDWTNPDGDGDPRNMNSLLVGATFPLVWFPAQYRVSGQQEHDRPIAWIPIASARIGSTWSSYQAVGDLTLSGSFGTLLAGLPGFEPSATVSISRWLRLYPEWGGGRTPVSLDLDARLFRSTLGNYYDLRQRPDLALMRRGSTRAYVLVGLSLGVMVDGDGDYASPFASIRLGSGYAVGR